jgi:hypothetical protein
MNIKDTKTLDGIRELVYTRPNSPDDAENLWKEAKDLIIQDRTKLIESLIPEEDFYSFYIGALVDVEGYWKKVDNFEDIPEPLRDTPGCWRKHYYDDSYKHKFLEILEEALSKLKE